MNSKIIIATHKKYQMPDSDIYIPVHVGAEGKESIGYTGDNTGDNISTKNPYYCELTGLYWAWKNVDADYLGLAHYRRHFCLKKQKSDDKFDLVLTSEQLVKLCSKYSIVLPKKRKYYIESLSSHYEHTHYSEHLEITRKIVLEKYPEYIESYDATLRQTSGYMFNMFVMRRDLFNGYCEWLFDILFDLEGKKDEFDSLKVENLSAFQARFYGRISEILLNVWLNYQISTSKIKKEELIEINHIHMEPINWCNKVGSFLKAKFLGEKYGKSF